MAASPVGAITVEQLLRSQAFVVGVRSRIGATGNVFQKFYNMGIDGPIGQQPVSPGTDSVVWDYFDNTRTIAEIRPALSGPARPVVQKAGTASGALLRFYEAVMFEDNKIAGYRPLGKPVGTLSKSGEDYVARQLKNSLQRQMNAREFAVSRMFRGGFDITNLGGDRQTLVELSAGQISINYQLPSSHLTQLAAGPSGAAIIASTWATASNDLIIQHQLLRQASERESGLPVHHGWCASQQYVNLINNTALRNAGGSAYRVWESLQTNKMETMAGFRERGDEVVFRALPQFTYHVYDGVLNVNQSRDSIAEADSSLFIPTDKVIFTPDPGDWCGQAVGQEIFTKNHGGRPETLTGQGNWERRVIEPTSGVDLHIWSKYLPILYVPRAIWYATVIGF